MITLSSTTRIFVYTDPTDMRKSFDGLARLVHAVEEPGGPTMPIPGSDYGFGVYTQVTVNKFADHLPLYRGEDIFARAGMMIPRNTQFGMLGVFGGPPPLGRFGLRRRLPWSVGSGLD